MKLSVIIPCYNERETVLTLLKKVENVDLGAIEKEIIVVDDCSTDGTRELLRDLAKDSKNIFLFQERNQGKGSALRAGFRRMTGDIVIIQDADLEYDPNEYPQLIEPILRGEHRVVYGSRERNALNRTHSGNTYYAGGLFLTWLTNLLYGSALTDEPTCYKIFDAALLASIPLQCRRFEFCPEITAKLLRRGIVIKEVPISYHPRRAKDGKKIKIRDGLQAIWTLIKYRYISDITCEISPHQ